METYYFPTYGRTHSYQIKGYTERCPQLRRHDCTLSRPQPMGELGTYLKAYYNSDTCDADLSLWEYPPRIFGNSVFAPSFNRSSAFKTVHPTDPLKGQRVRPIRSKRHVDRNVNQVGNTTSCLLRSLLPHTSSLVTLDINKAQQRPAHLNGDNTILICLK